MSSCGISAIARSLLIYSLVVDEDGSFAYAEGEPGSCIHSSAHVSGRRSLLQSSNSKFSVLGSTVAESPAFQQQRGEMLSLSSVRSSVHSLKQILKDAGATRYSPSLAASSWKQPEHAVEVPDDAVDGPEHTVEGPEHAVEPAEGAMDELAKVKKSMHCAVAIMLLGFVAFVMALFYLVNFPDDDIQVATWRLLSTTMSIFIAVLMFSGTQHFLAFLTGSTIGEEGEGESEELKVAIGHSSVTPAVVAFTFIRFSCFWVALQTYMYFVHTRSGGGNKLKAVATLGSHIVAFSGMDAFGTLQEKGAFAGSLLHCVLGVVLLAIIIWALFYSADMIRHYIAQLCSDPEEMEGWLSECNSAQHESAALILGLLISQCIRFAIIGSLPPLEGGSPLGRSAAQVHTLFAVAICLGLLVVALEVAMKSKALLGKAGGINSITEDGILPVGADGRRYLSSGLSARTEGGVRDESGSKTIEDDQKSLQSRRSKRVLRVIRETLSNTMAWCLAYWGRWAFWMWTGKHGLGYGDKMVALLATSLFMSAFCFLGILAIDFVADRIEGTSGIAGIEALGNSFGLVLGLAWECTFHEAVAAIGSVQIFPIGYELNVLVLIFTLVGTTLPAWMLYILPEASNTRSGKCHFRDEDSD